MADNVAITAGSGTTVSTEEVTTLNGGVVSAQHVQRVAKAFRTADATAVDAATGAGAVNTGTQRMTLASDDPAVAHLATLVSEAQGTTPVNMYPLPVTPVKGMTTQITDTTSTAVTGIGAGGSGVFNYITQITVVNADATVGTIIELQDGNAGTTFYRLPAPAAINSVGVTGSTFTFPTPLKQTTANTALYVKCTTTSADVYVSATGFQA